jgi:hypothetical protein
VAADGPPAEVFRDERALADAGSSSPDVVVLEDALREAGVLSGAPVRDADDLIERLERIDRGRVEHAARGGRERNDVGAGAA